tara:strand:+ start:563 stop:1063 length:501 start_codon:yes stop_codon:yes gene_type:complete
MGSKRSAPNISNSQIRPTRMAGESLGSTDRNRESHIRPIRRTEGATTSRERREAFDKKVENLSPERRKEFEENRFKFRFTEKEGGRPRRDISKSTSPARGVVKQINKPRPPRENEDKRPAFVRRRENAARRSALVRRKEERNNPKDSNFSNIMEGRREKNIARSDI